MLGFATIVRALQRTHPLGSAASERTRPASGCVADDVLEPNRGGRNWNSEDPWKDRFDKGYFAGFLTLSVDYVIGVKLGQVHKFRKCTGARLGYVSGSIIRINVE